MIKTLCKDCVFSIFEANDSENLLTQTDCAINKLNINKAELIKDNDILFYKLDYLCKFCRNSEWAENNSISDNEEYLKLIRQENIVYTDLIVLIHSNHILADVERLISQIKSKYIKQVIFIVNNEKINLIDLNRLIIEKFNYYKWRISIPLLNNDIDACILDNIKYIKSPYYMIVEFLSRYNDKLPETIDYAINDKEQNFCMVQPEEGYHHFIIQNRLQNIHPTLTLNEIYNHYKDTQWNNLIITQDQLNCR